MVWVNPPNRIQLYRDQAHLQCSLKKVFGGSTQQAYKMFNRDVDLMLREHGSFVAHSPERNVGI